MTSVKIILEHSDRHTIAAQFTPSKRVNANYQSEAMLERELIATLQAQGYEHAHIKDEKELEANLRQKLQNLNATTLKRYRVGELF